MSFWSRMANVFRNDRLSREIDEELQRHIADAIEQGRDPVEARRAFGSVLRNREESLDVHLVAWLDSLRADAVFSWRQLMNRKVTSGAAILSHDYWTRRFAQDRSVIGRTFRMGDGLYQIVGVAQEGFTGTETGTVTDVFLPMMMKNPQMLASTTNFWLRTLVELKPGATAEPVRERLRATFRDIQQERAKSFVGMSKRRLEQFFQERLLLDPAGSGRSNLQRDYGRTLLALGILVMLVLVIASVNVANLMTAQAAARAREMALRVAIGAGRWRLVQLVMVECAWLALLATAIGGWFAWWSAPFIVGMINPPDNPVRLMLPADWRVAAFSLALTCGITLLFGLAPAMRASDVRPVSALKGGSDPHSRSRMMRMTIALQVSFCFLVLFVAGLFATTFDRLTSQPIGFSPERVVNLQAVAQRPQPPIYWDQVADRLRAVPGVDKVALTVWPLMSGESANGAISVNGAPPSEVLSDFLRISPGWLDTMRIPLIDGRDFRAADMNPSVAIVNQAFAKQFFNGDDPTGKWFENQQVRFQIVGFVRDARSRDGMRRPIRPTAYFPFDTVDSKGASMPMGRGTFVVRTRTANPMALAPGREVSFDFNIKNDDL
jgi:predicted permease